MVFFVGLLVFKLGLNSGDMTGGGRAGRVNGSGDWEQGLNWRRLAAGGGRGGWRSLLRDVTPVLQA